MKRLINCVSLCLSSSNKGNTDNLTVLFRTIMKKGIVRPDNLNDYDTAIDLLSKLRESGLVKELDTLSDLIDRIEFARNLLKYRTQAGYSNRELANFGDLHNTYISKLERCCMPPPSASKIVSLAKALGVDPVVLYPKIKDNENQGVEKIYLNPLMRKIVKELDGLDNKILEYFHGNIKDFKKYLRL